MFELDTPVFDRGHSSEYGSPVALARALSATISDETVLEHIKISCCRNHIRGFSKSWEWNNEFATQPSEVIAVIVVEEALSDRNLNGE